MMTLTDWTKAAQQFILLEKASGFRPYIIFLFWGTVTALSIIWYPPLQMFAQILLGFVYGGFILIFCYKAISDPDFCRSEKHVQSMKIMELGDSKMKNSYLPGTVQNVETTLSLPDKTDKINKE